MITLTDIEARIVGCLIEKSLTTPAQYPLTLNSLTLACNQKSSRDPVMNLDETTVARGLSTLQQKSLTFQKSEPGNRVPKFGHHAENLLQGGSSKDTAILCVLFLRGPQTPGEIKTRSERFCQFESTAEVESLLNDLAARNGGPFVARLPRGPGQKEARFQHVLSGAPAPLDPPSPAAPTAAPTLHHSNLEERISSLERRLSILENALQEQLTVKS